MKIRKLLPALVLSVSTLFQTQLDACTNFIVTKGASADGSVMVTYNADAGGFMEPLRFTPAKDHPAGAMRDVYEWDTGKFLGKIKQVPHTYQVVGNMNEYQVAIGETTFTGREELQDTTGIIDYGSLIYIALERSKTAREAIKVMTDLVAEYGYYSTGESFSIADAEEAWVMDLIGKGPGNKGAVWVARRIPDGYVSGHANQSRIREIIKNDPENCIYSPDVIDVAIAHKYYNPAKDGEFKFADAYNPFTDSDVSGLFACESRVWAMFNRAAPSLKLSPDYWRAVKGAEPYPLFIKPDKKMTVNDVLAVMRDHFEGTEFDMTTGVGSGPYGSPYRWKPLGWQVPGDTVNKYEWERPVATQQTAFAFCTQARGYLPREVGGVFWYGPDDCFFTVYNPLYVNIKRVPETFTTASISEFSFDSGFWVFNLVANMAYSRYSIMKDDILKVQSEIENKYFNSQKAVENAAAALLATDRDAALEYLTDYSVGQSEQTVARWKKLWEYLVVKYNDYYINDVNVEGGRHPKSAYYGNDYYKRVVEERPDYYKLQWNTPTKDKKKKKK